MKKLLLICALSVTLGLQANGIYHVRDYGAKGDGKTLDHVAINKAIEAATTAGGGQVVLPPGTYLCGSMRLKSNVELHLMAGAKILAAPSEMKAYGLFARHVDGLHLQNVKFELMRPDERPDMVFEEVTNKQIYE